MFVVVSAESDDDRPETIGELYDRLPPEVPTEAYGMVWRRIHVDDGPDSRSLDQP